MHPPPTTLPFSAVPFLLGGPAVASAQYQPVIYGNSNPAPLAAPGARAMPVGQAGSTAIVQAPAVTPAPERSVAERLEDLEAYVNNGARNSTTNAPSKIAGPGPGHNGWMMTSAALVLFMTLPGLALFYGGLVRTKNVLATIMHSFAILCLVTLLWIFVGYSLAFGPDHGGVIGGWNGLGSGVLG